MIPLLFQIGIPLFFIFLGLTVGRLVERKHFKSLEEREQLTSDMIITQLKSYPGFVPGEKPPTLLVGEAIIATDYLKSFLAQIRNLFGGEVKSYQTLLIRARREATLRIIEEAKRQGYNAICNLRMETADVGGSTGTSKKASVMAAILASATAYNAKTG